MTKTTLVIALLVGLILGFGAHALFGQEVPPQKFTFEVDQNELNAIAQGLNELPKRVADPLLQKLTIQLQAQAKANADRTPKKDADAKPSEGGK